MLDTKPYKELLKRYNQLEADNFNEAYYILKEATAYSDYYGEQLSIAKKDFLESEFNYKQVKARKSAELAPNKVSEGERLALFNDEVIEAHKQYTETFYIERTLENINSTIDKIYFDSKNVWDKGNRDYRSKEK